MPDRRAESGDAAVAAGGVIVGGGPGSWLKLK